MNSLFVLIVLLAVLGWFSFGVVRALIRPWLDHRFRMTLLKKYEAHPELLESPDDVLDAASGGADAARREVPQDYTVTGIALALMGAGGMVAGHVLGQGTVAVGVYVGGGICLVLGVLVALLGVVIRNLSGTGLRSHSEPKTE